MSRRWNVSVAKLALLCTAVGLLVLAACTAAPTNTSNNPCASGYEPAANDASACCPEGFPFAANDGSCYESAAAVQAAETDSDGDGFSDYDEVAFTPGTDPFDRTDNPNNVRDTDGDGCSDFDELNVDGFCDNDPNVPGTGELDINAVLAASWQVFGLSLVDPSAGIIASAFAIDDNKLATNAHVVLGLKNVLSGGGANASVVQNETGSEFNIVGMWVHPEFDGSSVTSPDVAVIEVDGRLPSHLTLGSDATVRGLEYLQELTLCGFPGDVSVLVDFANLQSGDEFRPRASCFTGAISSLRPFDPSVPATPANSQLIQHSIATTGGTSGSPMLNDSGVVVAIHAAATTDEVGTNRFATRADALAELLNMIESGALNPVEIPVPVPVPVVPITNMDILRAACPIRSDAYILDAIEIVDVFWWEGLTYDEQIDTNANVCLNDPAPFDQCVFCLDKIVDFVYFVVH